MAIAAFQATQAEDSLRSQVVSDPVLLSSCFPSNNSLTLLCSSSGDRAASGILGARGLFAGTTAGVFLMTGMLLLWKNNLFLQGVVFGTLSSAREMGESPVKGEGQHCDSDGRIKSRSHAEECGAGSVELGDGAQGDSSPAMLAGDTRGGGQSQEISGNSGQQGQGERVVSRLEEFKPLGAHTKLALERQLSEMKQKLDEEGSKCSILSKHEKFVEHCCMRCCSPFTFLVNTKRRCGDCKFNVCKNCCSYQKQEKVWVCCVCQQASLYWILKDEAGGRKPGVGIHIAHMIHKLPYCPFGMNSTVCFRDIPKGLQYSLFPFSTAIKHSSGGKNKESDRKSPYIGVSLDTGSQWELGDQRQRYSFI
ncbi:Rab effector MyRIP [Galemys pyrenaicus]|uniref:Rab effector MyRIP n=1 Tax=Galemys pyrenaicus TaxID=202257 RepID=A0A8J6BBX0_GALPY|nr:Rab effector MyRIP [Galemys pyrenaicus]